MRVFNFFLLLFGAILFYNLLTMESSDSPSLRHAQYVVGMDIGGTKCLLVAKKLDEVNNGAVLLSQRSPTGTAFDGAAARIALRRFLVALFE